METLYILEEKIKLLVAVSKDLQKENEAFKKETATLQEENEDLKTENARLAESNAQLSTQLRNIEDSMLKESGHVLELKEEQIMTRSVLDELLKSIDSIVEK